jgi:outer membrane protein assembly factor BamB
LPIPFHTTVVVGDFEGYLHFFSSIDGAPVARLRQGKKAISSDPLVVANRLYVQSDNGSVAAYEVVQKRRQQRAPEVAEPADES